MWRTIASSVTVTSPHYSFSGLVWFLLGLAAGLVFALYLHHK